MREVASQSDDKVITSIWNSNERVVALMDKHNALTVAAIGKETDRGISAMRQTLLEQANADLSREHNVTPPPVLGRVLNCARSMFRGGGKGDSIPHMRVGKRCRVRYPRMVGAGLALQAGEYGVPGVAARAQADLEGEAAEAVSREARAPSPPAHYHADWLRPRTYLTACPRRAHHCQSSPHPPLGWQIHGGKSMKLNLNTILLVLAGLGVFAPDVASVAALAGVHEYRLAGHRREGSWLVGGFLFGAPWWFPGCVRSWRFSGWRRRPEPRLHGTPAAMEIPQRSLPSCQCLAP